MRGVVRKNPILIALDIVSPSRDNRQRPPPVPQRETLAMTRYTRLLRNFMSFAGILLMLLLDALRFLLLCLRPTSILAAENLFLRKQLALYLALYQH
jgi:hypothetical protein